MTKKIKPVTATGEENILLDAFTNKQYDIAKTTDMSVLFAAALQLTGETLEMFTKRTEHDDEHDKASKELQVFIKALNPIDWKADYKNHNQLKYFPLHWFQASAFRTSWAHSNAYSYVGSRFALATSGLAEFVGRVFIDKYEILYTS